MKWVKGLPDIKENNKILYRDVWSIYWETDGTYYVYKESLTVNQTYKIQSKGTCIKFMYVWVYEKSNT